MAILPKRKRRRVVLAETDSHAGHMLGLCNPAAHLLSDDGLETIGPNVGEFQRYAWGLRLGYINKVFDIAGRDNIIHIHGGDITQGHKYKDQLLTTRLADQFSIAEANMWPIYDRANVKTGRIITGTSSHIFGEGSAEIEVASRLRLRYPKKNIRPLAHSLLEIEGIEFDVTHHGPGAGIRQWTRGNVARHYLRSKMWQDYKVRGRVPRVFLRGHYHTFVHETIRERFGDEYVESHLIVLPSWCGMTEFARKSTQSEYELTNGLVAFEIVPGDQIPLRVHPFVKTLDLRTKETL
jgi:hypothetical protein